ncbi:immunoglobulin superfamily DCC subclass member 4 [Rhinophrynus dorsalis]
MALGRLSLLWGLHWAGCVLVVAAGENLWLDLSCRAGPTSTVLLPSQRAILNCDLGSTEVPSNVTWTKDGDQLDTDEVLSVLPNGSLVISHGDNIEGSYLCAAQDSFGVVMGRSGTVRLASLPPFHQQPEPQIVMLKNIARFQCGISGLPRPEITWQKDQSPLPSEPRFLTLPSGILQISGVQEEDAGLYRCVAANALSTRYSNEAQLSVEKGAVFEHLSEDLTINRAPQNLTVEEGQSAVMECRAWGDVEPLVSWIRQDGKPVSSDIILVGETNLLFPQAQPHHAGIYVCRANKPQTRHFVTAAAVLRVLVHPVIIQPPETITRARAGTARFVCRAEGDPEPTISWLKNGQLLHSNGRMRIQARGSLVITQIALEDVGYYQCVAENSVGSTCATAKLYVTIQEGLPGPPQVLRALAVSSRAVTIGWNQPESNWESVIGFSLHYTKTGGSDNMEYQFAVNNDTTELLVRDLEPATSYTFYVVAYSQQGASRASQPVIVKTWDDVPAAAPSLSLSSESPSDLCVSWHPLPPEMSNGHIIKYSIEYGTQKDGVISSVEVPGNESQLTLPPLQPNKVYKVRISASTTAGYGPPSQWIQHRTLDRDNQTQNLSPIQLKVSARTDSLSLSWQLPSSELLISGFRLYYRMVCPALEEGISCQQQGENWDMGPIKLKKKRRQYEITQLVPGRLYQVRLVSYNKKKEVQEVIWEGKTRHILSLAPDSPAQRIPPLPPSHIEAEPNSSTSVWVRWRRPALITSKIVNYTVRCGPWGVKNASLVTYHNRQVGASEEILVSGLKPYTRYEFAVQSNGVGIDGPYSNIVEKMTFPDRPSSPPADLVLHPVSQSSIQAHWHPPVESNGIILQYLILYSANSSYPDEMWTLLTREGNVFSAEVQSLQSGTKYFFKMGAKTVSGWGPYTSVVEVETLPARPPDVLDMNSVTGIIVGVCLCLLCLLLCMCASFQQGKQRDVGSDLGSRSSRGPTSYQRARQGSCSQSHGQDSHELETLMPTRQEDTPSVAVPEVTELIGTHGLIPAPQTEDKNQLKMKPSWNGSVTQNWANHITSYTETITGDPSSAANGTANPLPTGGLRMTLHDLSYEPIKMDAGRNHRNHTQNQVEADVIVHSDFSASERSGRCAGLESEEDEEDLSLDQDRCHTGSPTPVSSPLTQSLEVEQSQDWSKQALIPTSNEITMDSRDSKTQILVNGFHRSVDSQELQTSTNSGFCVEGGEPHPEDVTLILKSQQDLTLSNTPSPLHPTSPVRLCTET